MHISSKTSSLTVMISTKIPFALQYNKRDLPNAMSMGNLRSQLNPMGVPRFRGSSDRGPRGLRDAGLGQQDGRSGP